MTSVNTLNNYNTYSKQYAYSQNLQETPQTNPVSSNNICFTGDQFVPQQSQKKSSAGKIIGFSLLGLAAVLGTAMHFGGGIRNAFKNKEVFSSVKNGFKNIFHVKEKTVNPIVENVIPSADKGAFTVTKDGSIRTCTIPGKKNYSHNIRTQGTVAQQATKLGVKPRYYAVPEGASVKSYTYTYKGGLFGLNKYTVTVKNGKVAYVKNSKNKSVNLGENALKKIQENIEKAKNGDTKGLKDYVVQSYQMTENGVKSQYKRQNGIYNISSFISDKFAVESDEAIAYCAKNPDAKALVDAVRRGEQNLHRVSGEVNSRLGTFKIADGEILGFTERGIYYPSTDAHFIAMQEKNPQLFKDILENRYRFKTETFGI